MTLGDWLLAAIDYDRNATGLWLRDYRNLPEPNQAEPVLHHLLWALEIWLSRVNPDAEIGAGDFNHRLEQASDGWTEIVKTRPLDEVIEYQNSSGKSFKRQISAIMFHVVNHGSYHRGQLRAIADEQGYLDFPETDLNLYLIQENLFGE